MNISTIHNTWFPPHPSNASQPDPLNPISLGSSHWILFTVRRKWMITPISKLSLGHRNIKMEMQEKTRVCNTINVCVLLTLQDQRRPSAKTYTFIYIYGYNSLALAKHLYLLDSWCVCGLSKSHALLTAIVWPNCKGKHTYNQILIDAFIVGRQCTNSRDNLSSGKQEQQQVYVKQTLKITLRKQSQCS